MNPTCADIFDLTNGEDDARSYRVFKDEDTFTLHFKHKRAGKFINVTFSKGTLEQVKPLPGYKSWRLLRRFTPYIEGTPAIVRISTGGCLGASGPCEVAEVKDGLFRVGKTWFSLETKRRVPEMIGPERDFLFFPPTAVECWVEVPLDWDDGKEPRVLSGSEYVEKLKAEIS